MDLPTFHNIPMTLKGHSPNFTNQSLFKGLGGPRGSYSKSDKVSQVMSIEAASVWTEDYKSENEKNLALERSEFTRPLEPTPPA